MNSNRSILILALVLVATGTAGCFDIKIDTSPQARLGKDPTLTAACQYEWWSNQTASFNLSDPHGIRSWNQTPVYWVCYYRDGKTDKQLIGWFEGKGEAMTYIWYYIHPHEMPLIYGDVP